MPKPFAGGKSAGNSRSFVECIPRQAVPTASGITTFPQRQGIGKQQLFFDCVHFRAVSQVLEGAFPNGRASGTTTFPQRQGIGDNDLSPTASSMEPFAGGKCEIYTHTGQIKIEIK